mmetsp:Transcript_30856/g.77481  ORF Transcript_30856/g.77481 Transcript_30856/m.77481 type:complete len:236 (-) Transcript_30856:696-1403(-)
MRADADVISVSDSDTPLQSSWKHMNPPNAALTSSNLQLSTSSCTGPNANAPPHPSDEAPFTLQSWKRNLVAVLSANMPPSPTEELSSNTQLPTSTVPAAKPSTRMTDPPPSSWRMPEKRQSWMDTSMGPKKPSTTARSELAISQLRMSSAPVMPSTASVTLLSRNTLRSRVTSAPPRPDRTMYSPRLLVNVLSRTVMERYCVLSTLSAPSNDVLLSKVQPSTSTVTSLRDGPERV